VRISERLLREDRSVSSLVCRRVGKVWAAPHGLAVEALRGIDLAISAGEFVAILGPSGCGKSTLLEMIAGLETRTAGDILIDGVSVTGPNPKAVMVFQEHSLFPWLSVEDNVAFGLKMKGVPLWDRRERAREVLRKVRLSPFAKHYPHQLSGGMKQRVAIARALVDNPEFILMDEPFAALDFQTRVLMQQFLLEIWTEFKSTILFVTHQIDEAILLADRVVVMSAGPGTVIEEVPVDLPRPRSYTAAGFNDYRVRLTAHMEREVMKAHAAELA
jgi:NitT/TauT family transport system ATP-binding protein